MRHQDLLLNHRLESWVFPDAASRNAPGAYVSSDVGRISYQGNTGQYFRLLSTTPTWILIAPFIPGAAAFASVQTGQLSPAATASIPGVMMGLGSSAKLTPTASGKLHVTVTGIMQNSAANISSSVGLYFGTVTPPANGVPVTGTPTNVVSAKSGTFAANTYFPFSLAAVITGQAVGTLLWFDLLAASGAGGSTSLILVTISAHEIP